MKPWELSMIGGALIASGVCMMAGMNAGPSLLLAGLLCAGFGLRRCWQ